MTLQVEKSGDRCDPASVVSLGCRLLGLSLSGALLWSVLLIFFATLHFFAGRASAFFLLYWIMTLFVPGIMYFEGKGRALRSLPIDRSETGTLLWVSTVWIMPLLSLPLPLILGDIGGVGAGDVLFFSALVFTLSSSAALFLVATHFQVAGSAWMPSDVFGVRSLLFTRRQRKPRLLLGLGILPLVVLIVHPAWRVAQSDWVHYALIGTAVFSLIPSFGMRACLWGDFMNASRAKAESRAPHSAEITFVPRWRSRLAEWHRGAVSGFINGSIVVLLVSATSLVMRSANFPRTDWRTLVWLAFIMLPSVFREQGDAIRAYRMLPLSGISLCLRLLYRVAVSLVFVLAPLCGMVLFQSSGALVNLLSLAFLGLALSLVCGALKAIWSRDLAFVPIVLIAVAASDDWVLSEARNAVAATGLFLTVVGIVLYYVAITRCSRTYRPTTLRGTGR